MIDNKAREEIDEAEESFIKELSSWAGKYASEYAASVRLLRKLLRSHQIAEELYRNHSHNHSELYFKIVTERMNNKELM